MKKMLYFCTLFCGIGSHKCFLQRMSLGQQRIMGDRLTAIT